VEAKLYIGKGAETRPNIVHSYIYYIIVYTDYYIYYISNSFLNYYFLYKK
jgi:hypothetical protein